MNTLMVSTSVFVYNSIRLQKDTLRKHVFEVLRIGLGGSSRGGVYNVNGTATRINQRFIDVDVLLPMRVTISKNLNMQYAFGATLGFKTRQTSNTPEVNVFQPGAVFEMGLATMRGSVLGFSVSQTFSTYPILNVSLVFGITLGDIRNSYKMRRS